MSDRLIQQLKMITRVVIGNPPSDFSKVEIPRQEVLLSSEIRCGDALLIELPDYILHPSNNFDLHVKWNHNIPPVDNLLCVKVLQCMGNMIQVDGVGYDIKTQSVNGNKWSGWLPRASIKVKQKY